MVGHLRGCVPATGPLPAANQTELEGLCKIFDGLYGAYSRRSMRLELYALYRQEWQSKNL